MPLRETEALVLRTYRLGEADKIVSLFTRELGRVRAVASGAQRPRSRYGGSLEPLSHIRLWLYERENRDLLRLQSAEVLESFFVMQREYRMQVAGQYLAEVTERFLPEREVNDRVFRLLLAVLHALKSTGEIGRPLTYFDYWLLRLAGYLPDLRHCATCGQEVGQEAFFGTGAVGLACGNCRTGGSSSVISREVLAYAASAEQMNVAKWMQSKEPSLGCKEARTFFEDLIETHSEKKLVTRLLLAGVA